MGVIRHVRILSGEGGRSRFWRRGGTRAFGAGIGGQPTMNESSWPPARCDMFLCRRASCCPNIRIKNRRAGERVMENMR